jgi:hypothetical protein
MVSVLASVDRAFEPRSGKTKDNQIGIDCFSAMHAALKRTSKVSHYVGDMTLALPVTLSYLYLL